MTSTVLGFAHELMLSMLKTCNISFGFYAPERGGGAATHYLFCFS